MITISQVIFILTNAIFIYVINRFFSTVLGEDNREEKINKTFLILYFIILSVSKLLGLPQIIFVGINLAFYSLISISYQSSFLKKVLSILFLFLLTVSIDYLTVNVLDIVNAFGVTITNFNETASLFFTRNITIVLVYMVSRIYQIFSVGKKLDFRIYILFFSALIGTIFLFFFLLQNEQLPVNNLIISATILIAINLTIIVFDERVYETSVLENERKILEEQNKAYENQIELIIKSNESLQILRHDLINHLNILADYNKEGKHQEVADYIKLLAGDVDKKSLVKSNNFVIDTVINSKFVNQHDLVTKFDIAVPTKMNILAYDLGSILSNLLDNAITAASKSFKKEIDIEIKVKLGNLIIKINNSYDGNLIIENDEFLTTKDDPKVHGFGIKSVKKTLKLYDGEMIINYTNDHFFVTVLIPY